MKIHQYIIMSAPTAAQWAGIEALDHGEPDVRDMVAEYDRRRKAEAKRIGVRPSTLDDAVKAQRQKALDDLGQDRTSISQMRPWPKSVKGENLLDDL